VQREARRGVRGSGGDDLMMIQADERALLAAMARGDQAALRQLYALYRPPLRRYLWQQLDGDEPAVEDALQEAFAATRVSPPGSTASPTTTCCT
jgi:DNA-directed RNA polymerase specialized sigma24 family protein